MLEQVGREDETLGDAFASRLLQFRQGDRLHRLHNRRTIRSACSGQSVESPVERFGETFGPLPLEFLRVPLEFVCVACGSGAASRDHRRKKVRAGRIDPDYRQLSEPGYRILDRCQLVPEILPLRQIHRIRNIDDDDRE